MERKDLAWTVLVVVILVTLASLVIPVLIRSDVAGQVQQNPAQQLQQGPGQPERQNQPQPPGLEESKHLKTVISFVNIGLIVPLFIIYVGIYRRMRSSFTLGLLAVIFALGLYAVTSCPLIVSLLGGRTGDIGLFQIIPDLCTTIALVILVRISME